MAAFGRPRDLQPRIYDDKFGLRAPGAGTSEIRGGKDAADRRLGKPASGLEQTQIGGQRFSAAAFHPAEQIKRSAGRAECKVAAES